MKFLSDRLTSASGSIGGTTFAHNRSGLYTRARRVPVNRRTAPQLAVRNILSNLQAAFPTLTAPQIDGWNDCAEYWVVTNKLGQPLKLTAQSWFIKLNTPRVQAGLTRVDDPPVIYNFLSLTAPTVTVTAAGTTASVAFDPTDDWATAVGGALLVYASRNQNAQKNFYAGPYQLAGSVLGAVIPPTSPATIALPFVTGPTGSKQFFRFVAVGVDGRTSATFLLSVTV